MRRRQRDAAPLKAAEAGCARAPAPAPARPKWQRDTPEGPPRLPGDQVLRPARGQRRGKGAPAGAGSSLGPGAGAKRGGGGNTLSCPLPARPWGSNACRLRGPLRGAEASQLPPEWTGGLRDAAAGSKRRSSSSSFACQRSIYGPLSGRTQGEAQHHLTRIRKGNLRATGSTPAVALGAKSFSVQLLVAAVGHMPRPRRDPGLCMASLADLLFHVRIREQFRYEFCLREPNPASLFPAPRTIPKNKSFLNSQTRKPTWHTTLCLDRE